jgi:hypothetical protein
MLNKDTRSTYLETKITFHVYETWRLKTKTIMQL